MQTVIVGTGSFIPQNIKQNSDFGEHIFYNNSNQVIDDTSTNIITKFQQITGIKERRYADASMNASCMAMLAAKAAIADADLDIETIDQLILAHNFGDVSSGNAQADTVPSIAARVKNGLGIKNPLCVAYDILFGCPGWLQGLIHANAFTKSGMAKTCLVIGTEALSRVIDPYDRDSMIYSDGAGAVVTHVINNSENNGILGSVSASYTEEQVNYISMGKSNRCDSKSSFNYLKMQGRKVYEFALTHVPLAIKSCLDSCNVFLSDVKQIFIHQANQKMDEAIVKRLFQLYSISDVPTGIMPMNIEMLGNSSVATIPTLFDMVKKGLIHGHSINKNDIVIFASVGAGMNINALCYRV